MIKKENSMFREMRRKKQALSYEECIHILNTQPRGVLSMLGDDDYPYGIPLDHYYDEKTHCLYFHCAKTGYKIDAMTRHPKVSYCVYDEGYRNEGEWALNIKSVVCFGHVEFVEDDDTIVSVLTHLTRKFTDDEDYIKKEIAKFKKSVRLFAVHIDHLSGKIVNES
jgi:nitroimidazol reductase NimA-like FMN-containing flavoprotein (pyridoxamine 5'-phosphate oxidase superfamily)